MGPLVIPTMAYMPIYIGKHLVAASWWYYLKTCANNLEKMTPSHQNSNCFHTWQYSHQMEIISYKFSIILASILRTCFGILPFISGYCDRNTRSADNSCVLLEYLSLTKIRPLSLQYIFSSQICQGPVWKLNPETSPRNSGTTLFHEFDQKFR